MCVVQRTQHAWSNKSWPRQTFSRDATTTNFPVLGAHKMCYNWRNPQFQRWCHWFILSLLAKAPTNTTLTADHTALRTLWALYSSVQFLSWKKCQDCSELEFMTSAEQTFDSYCFPCSTTSPALLRDYEKPDLVLIPRQIHLPGETDILRTSFTGVGKETQSTWVFPTIQSQL